MKYLHLNSSFDFGLSLNNRGSVFLMNYPPADMLRMAEMAEDMHFGSVWVGDSLIDSPRYEPIALLGAVAVATSKVKLGGSIIQPHFRNPIILALSWATLDQLSNGRMILTFGTGGGTPAGVAKEAELVGVDVKKRGKALEENVEILRHLWNGETLNHSGEIYRLTDARIGYFPVQKPPPIWIAAGVWIPKDQGRTISATPGYTRKREGSFSGGFERVGRLADGWFAIMITPEEFKVKSEMISDIARKNGRDPTRITRAVECWFNMDQDRLKARNEITKMIEGYFANQVDDETVERWSIYGTREDCIKRIEEFKEAGAQVIKLIMGSRDQQWMLEKFGKSILPSFI